MKTRQIKHARQILSNKWKFKNWYIS